MSFDNNDQNSSKNFIVAMVFFMLFMFGYDYFFGRPVDTAETNTTHQEKKPKAPVAKPTISLDDAMSRKSRVSFENEHITASVDLAGGVIDALTLKGFKETTADDSKNVMLLKPKDTKSQFFYAISYNDKTNNENVSRETFWTRIETKNGREVVLKARTKGGLDIERTVTVDDGYMLDIRDRVLNTSDKSVTLGASSDLVRDNPKYDNYAVVHEGLVGSSDGKVEEVKYGDIDDRTTFKKCSWLGYTDIYWLCSVVNEKDQSAVSYEKTSEDAYKISLMRREDVHIAPNAAVELHYSIFAGPKDIRVLKNYRDTRNLDKFEMAIDFGWFFIITKPLIQLMDVLASALPNMGLVILLLTLMLRFITDPLMKKSFLSAAKMRALQPKIALLQKSYAHDKLRMNQEMMALYRKEKVSPLSGCLPMLLQAPIFFCLYKVFFISIEMRHAPLFGWIRDLSAPDPLCLFNLFGLIDWTPPSFLQIGVWPLVMGLTMFLQQKLSSFGAARSTVQKSSEQKMQENMMLIMPVVFTYVCASFPVAVVVYWTISNIFSMAQQCYVNRVVLGRK